MPCKRNTIHQGQDAEPVIEGSSILNIRLHPHAVDRLPERGALAEEIVETVTGGERFPAKYGRTGFRRNFSYGAMWRGRYYDSKQIEAYAVWEENGWLVISLVTKFF